jgi:hypothetical protein
MRLMGITECTRALVLMISALMAAVATSRGAYISACGAFMVLATLAAVWFFWRPALPSEYRHIKLKVGGGAHSRRA